MSEPVPDRLKVLWVLPTHGDSRYLGTSEGGRAVDLPYLRQVVQAADGLGYYGVLLPTGRSCEDSWVVASALAPLTERLRFLVAVRPGLQSPTLAARMTATLDRISNGRLLINVVTGGDPVENKGDGIFLDHATRDEVTREFLEVYRGCCQTNANSSQFGQVRGALAGAERPPLGQSGGAGFLVVISAGEAAL